MRSTLNAKFARARAQRQLAKGALQTHVDGVDAGIDQRCGRQRSAPMREHGAREIHRLVRWPAQLQFAN